MRVVRGKRVGIDERAAKKSEMIRMSVRECEY